MASMLPLPIRIAAGLIGAGLDRLRRLPEDLPALSVTLAGQAVRASMRVRQELAGLANRGDELLAPIVERPQEHPAWARFDDEPGTSSDDGAADGDPTASGVAGPDDPVGSDGRTADLTVMGGMDTGPAALPEYDGLRAAQVRARVRGMDAEAVSDVLEYERATRARAAFLTLLENRLATVRAGGSGDPGGGAPA